jgi:hypothetical protein
MKKLYSDMKIILKGFVQRIVDNVEISKNALNASKVINYWDKKKMMKSL